MAKIIDIIILYEKADRELDVACLLKVMLELKGLTVEIIQQDYDYGQALQKYIPRVVLLPFCYQNKSNNIYLLRWREAIFVNMTWEQLFYKGNKIAKMPRGDFSMHHVIHVAWSQEYFNTIASLGIPVNNILLCGNPAMALYKIPYRSYFNDKLFLTKKYKLNPNKKWIFFPENYNWAFYEEQMLSQMVLDGQSPEDVASMRVFANNSFVQAMNWCRQIVQNKDVELILRPRPSTLLLKFRERVIEAIGEYSDHMHIIKDETVREWILASDIVISSYSTSLIEAAIAGKKILMLEPHPVPEVLAQSWHQLVPRVGTYEEFDAFIDDSEVVDSYYYSPLGIWAEKNLLCGGDAVGLLVNNLEKICNKEINLPRTATRKSVIYDQNRFIPFYIWWVYKYFRTYLSQIKSLIGLAKLNDDIVMDVLARSSIEEKCTKWRDLITNYL